MNHLPVKPRTLVDTIVQRLLHQIDEGLLQSGARLRSIREAASDEGVSRNTMVEAYDRLVALGCVQARRGSGYFVSRARRLAVSETPAHVAEAVDVMSLLREQLERHYEVRVGDGRLPASWMEGSELGKHLHGARLASEHADQHEYGSPWGFCPLRARIALSLSERSIQVTTAQVLLTQGGNHGLDLIIRHLLTPGDVVLVDSPGYYPLFAKLKLAKAQMVGVRRRADGPDLDDLEAKAATTGAKVFFTQSLAHNPTGGSISVPSAHRVLQIAARRDLVVVEDDPFADLLPSSMLRLAALDQLDRVIYVGSFSKTLSASLRVGYVAAAPSIAQALCDLKMVTVVGSSAYVERLVHQLIVGGQYRRHLNRLNARLEKVSAEARRTLVELGLKIEPSSSSGFFLWAELPESLDERSLARKASADGIFLAPGYVFMPDPDTPVRALRINVAYAMNVRFVSFMKEALRTA